MDRGPHGVANAFNPAPHARPRAARGSAPLRGRPTGGGLSAPLCAADTDVSRGRLRLPLRGTERSAFGPNRSEGRFGRIVIESTVCSCFVHMVVYDMVLLGQIL